MVLAHKLLSVLMGGIVGFMLAVLGAVYLPQLQSSSPAPAPSTPERAVLPPSMSGLPVPRATLPAWRYPEVTRPGSGYTVTCADGWTSHSGGRRGACSHHGGVR